MKKILFIFAAGLILFVSCRKTRTCTCKYSNGQTETYTYPLSTKKNAEAYCNDEEYSGVSCELN